MELCVVSLIMLLCGLEGSGFIIAVGLSMLMAGVIIYYVNARIRGIQAAVEKQGNVLSQLINDMKYHVGGSMSLATPEAQAAAMEFTANQKNHSDLIPVSDDSDDSDEYDSDSEDDDDKSESSGAIILHEETSTPGVEMSVNELSGLRVIEANVDGAIAQGSTPQSPDEDSMSDDGDSSEDDPLIETLNPSTMEAISTLTVSKIDSNESESTELEHISSTPAESTIKSMRVNQLRDLAMNQRQVPESEVKSMKKPELLQLLLSQ